MAYHYILIRICTSTRPLYQNPPTLPPKSPLFRFRKLRALCFKLIFRFGLWWNSDGPEQQGVVEGDQLSFFKIFCNHQVFGQSILEVPIQYVNSTSKPSFRASSAQLALIFPFQQTLAPFWCLASPHVTTWLSERMAAKAVLAALTTWTFCNKCSTSNMAAQGSE